MSLYITKIKDLRLTKHLKKRERGSPPLLYLPPTTIKTLKPLRVFFFKKKKKLGA